MNAMNILKQLMNQASGSQSGAGGGSGVNRMVGDLASQFSGGGSKGSGSGGIDVKSLLGGGAVGLMLGSKGAGRWAAKR
ncbi:MAG: hypothetical protein ABR522_13900 [Marinobacter sp.]